MIQFNNIPDTIRTPGVFGEVDNSQALKGLLPNPHKVLVIGQKNVAATNPSLGTASNETLYAITRDSVADGYFGYGSLAARMCRKFKKNNPNTELYAIALSGGTAQASAQINFSVPLSFNGGSASVAGQTIKMLINGQAADLIMTNSMTATSIAAAFKVLISEAGIYPVTASASGAFLLLSCMNSGTFGNYMDVRFNYYDGDSFPTCFDSVTAASWITNFSGGAGTADLDDAWAVIENDTFQYICQPYIDATNLTSLEDELAERFLPLVDKQGHGFTAVRGTQASCTTLGNSRNSPHNTIMGYYDSPTSPEEWAAALCGQVSFSLNQDPARPVHYLELKGILPPPRTSLFTRSERDILLYDGIATWITDTSGKIFIERCITTYQKTAQGIPDPSYLDIETLATLEAIRYQFKARMILRFLNPRLKLASDSFPLQPGANIVRPKDIRLEIIALFAELQRAGLIENLQDFTNNLVVERDESDVNRVNVLLPPDLVNQFRILAGLVQFIL